MARIEEENKIERNKVLAVAVDRKLRAKGIDGIGGKNGGETEAAAEKHGRGTEAAAEKRGSETAGISFRRREAAAKAGKQGRE